MQRVLLNILLLCVLHIYGNASQIVSPDTLDLKVRLKQLWRQFRKDNKIQIHRYESGDSTVMFGGNKEKSLLASVMISNRSNQDRCWFFYNSNGVFRISIVDWKKSKVIKKKKRASCTYYFENDKVFYEIEDGKNRNPYILLLEAKKYWALASQYLKG